MQCVTTHKGSECFFMSTKGCSFTDGTCLSAIEACQGCDHTRTQGDLVFCNTYPNPAAKWKQGACNFASHIKGETKQSPKLNPLKASKRARRGG